MPTVTIIITAPDDGEDVDIKTVFEPALKDAGNPQTHEVAAAMIMAVTSEDSGNTVTDAIVS
jgi:hypothetical protein